MPTLTLTLKQVHEATLTLIGIINRKAPMPQKGKYRIERMYAKLKPEYDPIEARRLEMRTGYLDGNSMDAEPQIPPEKVPDFLKAWEDFAKDTIEITVEPIPLDQLCLDASTNGSIEAFEFASLGDLVAE